MFRAIRKDGQGEVKGWLFVRPLPKLMCFILEDSWTELTGWRKESWQFGEVEVIPSTIAMKTYQLDKAKEMIYGSFDLEGFGMTKGGDRLKLSSKIVDIIFKDGGFGWISHDEMIGIAGHNFWKNDIKTYCKIIGKQYDEEQNDKIT